MRNRVGGVDTKTGGRFVGRMSIVTVPGADVRGPSDAVYVKEVVTFFRVSTGVRSCGWVPKTFVAGVAKLLTKNFGIVPSSLMLPNWYDSWLKIFRTGRQSLVADPTPP